MSATGIVLIASLQTSLITTLPLYVLLKSPGLCFLTIPSKAVLVLPALIYLLLTTGPLSKRQLFLWSARRQLIIDGVFTVGWLVAATLWTTQFSCSTLCGLCSQFGYKHTPKGYYYFYENKCQCRYGVAISSGYNRHKLAERASVTSSDAKAVGQSLKALVRKAAKDGLDWPML